MRTGAGRDAPPAPRPQRQLARGPARTIVKLSSFNLSVATHMDTRTGLGHALARDMSRTTINLLKKLRCGAWTCRAPRAYGVLSQMIS